MRSIVASMLFIVAIAACQGVDNKSNEPLSAGNSTVTIPAGSDSTKLTSIEWLETHKDFGKITEGQKVEVAFRFKNTGDKPLVIERVQPSCGCTVAETPKEPIAPGGQGVIKGAFDSNGRIGTQHKSIYVETNTKEKKSHELVFELEVVKKT